MIIASKHQMQSDGVFTDFQGGIDRSIPPYAISPSAVIDATNFYYDPFSGYLTTRPGLKQYTGSALSDAVIGMSEFPVGGTERMILACKNQKLYYVDDNKLPVEIGILSGSGRPSFTRLNGLLVICSGGALQTWDGDPAHALSNTAQTLSFISDAARKDSARIIGFGDPAQTDRVMLSMSNDPTDWAFAATPENKAKYFDCGYKDKLAINGVATLKGYLHVFKKSPSGYQKRMYRGKIDVDSTYWSVSEVAKYHGTMSPWFIRELGENVFFVDKEGPKSLSMIESFSDLSFGVDRVGKPILPLLLPYIDNTGFTLFDPVYGVVMVKPSENSDLFYCLDYMNSRWTIFRYALNVQSGEYVLGKFYLGGLDGFVYEYDTALHQDNGTDYIKSVETRWFNQFPLYSEVTKNKYLDVIGLKDGSLSITVKNKGEGIGSGGTVFQFGQAWWEWSRVNSITPAAWTESLSKVSYDTLLMNDRYPGDMISFSINVTSGLCALGQLRAEVAATGKQK